MAGQQVHRKCRQKYCNLKYISIATKAESSYNTATESPSHVLRSAEKSQFQFNSDCAQPATNQGKRKSQDVSMVRTVELKETILAICCKRGDSWAAAVQGQSS